MSATVTIVTCVSNGKGIGPGHTAICIGKGVYSFENMGDWFSIGNEKSGWVTSKLEKFLEKYAFRPVILQRLVSRVNADKARRYIKRSMISDDDYGSSGVCSSQVANAVDAAWQGSFNPQGVDTPHKVYRLARWKGIVDETEWIWSGKGDLSSLVRDHLRNRLRDEYGDVLKIPESDLGSFARHPGSTTTAHPN